jgi:hypothetical protein
LEKSLKELEGKLEEKRSLESEIEKTKIHILTKREILASLLREEEELRQAIGDSYRPTLKLHQFWRPERSPELNPDQNLSALQYL